MNKLIEEPLIFTTNYLVSKLTMSCQVLHTVGKHKHCEIFVKTNLRQGMLSRALSGVLLRGLGGWGWGERPLGSEKHGVFSVSDGEMTSSISHCSRTSKDFKGVFKHNVKLINQIVCTHKKKYARIAHSIKVN